MNKIAVVIAVLLMAACSTTHKTDSSQAQQASTQNTTATTPVASSVTNAEVASTELQALQKESVFFDFDKSVVKTAYQGAIQKQADFIKEHKNDIVTLEGNADERGSREYNHALGNRRAVSVEKSLRLLGVSAAQIKTVSFGKDKPRLLCHEEKCWKENRRVDFVHNLH